VGHRPQHFDEEDLLGAGVATCVYFGDEAAGTHFIRDVYFAMLEDESIWVWQFGLGMGASVIIIMGMIVSILAAVIVWWISARRS
jgi:hypothetical protein